MTALFSPLSLGNLELSNRVVIAPMCTYSADDGCANDWHLMHYGQLAQSGAGLLIVEATAVEAMGRISAQDLGLWSDAAEAAMRPVLEHIRRHSGIKMGVQLGHAGRKAASLQPWLGGGPLPQDEAWPTLGASALSASPEVPTPAAATLADIVRVKKAFVDAALRAQRLGYDLIELHGAHGYLLHQFLSPLSNQRTDQYGGSLENRMRLTLEVFSAVRAAVGDALPVGVRLSASDWIEGGWDVEQSGVLARELQALGCAFLHVSSGGLSPAQQIPVGPGYQLPLAHALRAQLAMPVIGVGLITDPLQAQAALDAGDADAIAIARAALFNPRWPWHAAQALGAQVPASPQYLRCQPHGARGLFAPLSA
ncbi:NADH:flavin oxidoreductase/NADH oxidase [Comamonas endophytica]|uniref:NADH:flavin oxidoreductase/NADH oxidase n=1 Tax=Comamonas endophytica TaxID=2949090 RepID=A0ABY6G7R7_9BURK|nr:MULTISPECIES: NADH:flavin oxidoreductase/NADH oxidase [unclassified Acidovorax]MCD2514511.1 NADH:flavin oxidoreductase/NADH oxidase [Acidovorax sp. D4N7]UYG51091.1 NADH:flavin oxidoreductase/NADH oxidase [Acidovorax sp. 5MLIR]